jgi:uncharacterized membrane protein
MKTISFGVMHVSVAFVVVYLITGSIALGGLVAVIEPLVNTVAYHFHEKVWARIQRRRAMQRQRPRPMTTQASSDRTRTSGVLAA